MSMPVDLGGILWNGDNVGLNQANELWLQGVMRRDMLLKSEASLVEQAPAVDKLLESLESQWSVVQGLRNRDDRRSLNLPFSLNALDDCILAIVWEILHCSASSSIFGESIRELVVLLRSAALYQVEAKSGGTGELENVSAIPWTS
jgi:hypothetical protein